MSIISTYTNQSITWKHVASINKYNEPTYTTTTIKGRLEEGFKQVRTATGEEVTSSARCYTKALVGIGDLLDDRVVIALNKMFNLSGAEKFREVWLK